MEITNAINPPKEKRIDSDTLKASFSIIQFAI